MELHEEIDYKVNLQKRVKDAGFQVQRCIWCFGKGEVFSVFEKCIVQCAGCNGAGYARVKDKLPLPLT